MNGKQIGILWTGIIVVILMGLFPPIVGSYSIDRLNHLNFHLGPGYGSLLTSSSAKFKGDLRWQDSEFYKNNINNTKWINVIDFQKLLIQWSIVAAIAAGAIVSIKDTEAKPKE
jgi:hypothetical protein